MLLLPFALDMGKHLVEMVKPNEYCPTCLLSASFSALGTWAVLLAQGNGFRGALCYNIGSTSLDFLLLQMEHFAEQMDSQLSERKGRYLMYHDKKGRGYSRRMEKQGRRHILHYLGLLEPSNLSGKLGKT